MKTWFVNISEQYKYFTWTPERTGSTHFTNLLTKLSFQTAVVNEDNKIIEYKNEPTHNHFCQLIDNHMDYKFIITTRNPYAMMMSRTFAFQNLNAELTQKEIEWKLEHYTQTFRTSEILCCHCFQERKPDYFVRLENLYEDWLKIPFVKNHELYLSGELEKICKTRINEQKNTEDSNYWKKYYNQRLADLVYYNYINNFEFFGYDKNSWK